MLDVVVVAEAINVELQPRNISRHVHSLSQSCQINAQL